MSCCGFILRRRFGWRSQRIEEQEVLYYITAMLFKILLLLCLGCFSGASDSGIVEGTESKPHSRPYMVSLQQQKGQHHCGGALVRKDFVLTSAHCNKLGLTAVLGAHNIKKEEKSQQRIQVARYHVHPNYKDGLYGFDVMLLKLKTNSILNKYVKPIGLPKKDKRILADIKCSVAGWGMRFPNTAASDVLRESAVKTRSVNECKKIWGDYFNISQMICTHSSGKKGGICEGDSGGPLICSRDAQGIAAYYGTDKCDDPTYPNVFMKIPSFVQWIKEVMKKRD
ncbi:mast cell protease 1A-like isoform X2 [Gadus macrocephalus]|uniref:mast cell protease 1A-like isoform X2 n=1 Tax=Gadus macrocephalus TaxID=80720 RepID=UPI0028CB9481|nr:mast cell protease 1A-like isoform X2 [Gadus macrocephalus]